MLPRKAAIVGPLAQLAQLVVCSPILFTMLCQLFSSAAERLSDAGSDDFMATNIPRNAAFDNMAAAIHSVVASAAEKTW